MTDSEIRRMFRDANRVSFASGLIVIFAAMAVIYWLAGILTFDRGICLGGGEGEVRLCIPIEAREVTR